MIKDDLQKVWSALALYISMVRSGEIESPSSVAAKDEAFAILNRLLAESDSKPSSVLDVVGYLDDYGNFESYMQPWMADEPNVNWRPVYLHPPITKPENESVVKEFCGTDSGPDGDCTVHGFQDEHGVLHVTNVDCSDGKKA